MDCLPTLAAERLRLRQLTVTDVPALFRVFSDPQVMRYWSTLPLKDEAAARELYEDIVKLGREDVVYQWGRGLAHEAVSRLLDHAFGELALHRIEADVDRRNGASLALCGKLGFQREGLLRERYFLN